VVAQVLDRCPGSGGIRTPIPSLKPCPKCGQEVEVWSDELKARCSNCGAIDWCKAAKECLGEEKYNQLKGKSRGD